jgi:hypothetical protein
VKELLLILACAASEGQPSTEFNSSAPTVPQQPDTPSSTENHDHGDSLEEQAIHLMAIDLETTESSLVAKTSNHSMRVAGATRLTVRTQSRRTNRPTPTYGGIVIDGVLHMGHDAVTQAVLTLWAKETAQSRSADDLAWLAEYSSVCDRTQGPTDPALDPQCAGHKPRGITHADGRQGVRYWMECLGGMRPTTSQTLWEAWVQPDLTMKTNRVAICSAGRARKTPR